MGSPLTKAQRHMERVQSLGCVVCRNLGLGLTPAQVHHVKHAGRRIDGFHTIPLCFPHHQAGLCDPTWPVDVGTYSFHPWRKAFEAQYGTEQALLEQTRAELGQD